MNNSIDDLNESGDTITNVVRDLKDNFLTTSSSPFNLDDNTFGGTPTEIQSLRATLVHVRTKVELELPTHFSVIHIGKPNDEVPPDLDVSGFPHSQVVSRIHADIIRDDDDFYIEDTRSANGLYINHTPLPKGNRHRLKSGDRIALGKEDRVSFIFQLET